MQKNLEKGEIAGGGRELRKAEGDQSAESKEGRICTEEKMKTS